MPLPNLSLPQMESAQSQKHITHNEALEILDAVVQLVVQSFSETTPPLSPTEGQVWAIALGAVNDWAGQSGNLAVWSNGGWLFVTPRPGWRAALGTDLRVWDGAAWSAPDLPALQNLPGVGIGTSHDATNRLAVASPAVLLTHTGAGHQTKLNKNAPADTGSILFQTNWSGRAEMGTLGTDDFAIKCSPDGSTWATGLTVGATGSVDAPVSLSVGGSAVYARASVLGTVSEAAGVPTGALIEQGSGVNGSYVRYADGTQIAWAELTTSTTAGVDWTFAQPFVAPPMVTGSAQASASSVVVRDAAPSASMVTLSARASGTRRADPVHVMAFGRWF